ncbi:F0F1 ATP synthase subunit delta [Pseudopontixanthobacter vadosimaris]|uniref:F0F1 ATP synthase subunit delta n=1 Tax=Pseudopontixanthobacter vadosimaris TaxID=2726450 RepID=UPI0014757CBA
MEISAGIQASLAGRYAVALFDLASENGTVTQVENDLEKLDAAIRESADLRALIRNPQVSRKAAEGALNGVAGLLGIGPLTRNFLGVLAQNRRLSDLPAMIRAFSAIAAAQRGEITAKVSSAHALSETQLAALRAKLTAREGRTVKLSHEVDPELLGGLVVTIGSRRIDGSIRTRLNSLAQAMKGQRS